MADMKSLLLKTDEWLRHKIRAVYWKQWKKVRTKFKELKALGVEQEKAWICEMETGIVVDILYCRQHLTIRNSVN